MEHRVEPAVVETVSEPAFAEVHEAPDLAGEFKSVQHWVYVWQPRVRFSTAGRPLPKPSYLREDVE